MAESRALLLIADIGGYTKYMTLHRLGVAHAPADIVRLLEAGIDVILVHRLLKNAVPVPEYVLLSEDLYDSGAVGKAQPVEQELEGLGAVRAYFVDLGEVAEPLPPAEDLSFGRRLGETVSVIGRGMPYLLGLKRHQAEAH